MWLCSVVCVGKANKFANAALVVDPGPGMGVPERGKMGDALKARQLRCAGCGKLWRCRMAAVVACRTGRVTCPVTLESFGDFGGCAVS